MPIGFKQTASAAALSLFTFTATIAQSEIISETLNCEIKDTMIMAIKDGIPKRYTHYTDGINKGDALTLQIILTDESKLWMNLSPRGDVEKTILDKTFRSSDISSSIFLNDVVLRDGEELISTLDDDTITFTEFDYARPELKLGRYYKSDWDGTLVLHMPKEVQTSVLDCRTMGQSNLDKIVKVLLKMREKK